MAYIPERGDIVWLDFDPQVGHEQSGHRPALVVSSKPYNSKTKLALICPVTNKRKDYPFEVPIPSGLSVTGVILADQVKSLDFQGRNATFGCRLPNDVTDDVIVKLQTLLT
jgi:mRNA interferase MazF